MVISPNGAQAWSERRYQIHSRIALRSIRATACNQPAGWIGDGRNERMLGLRSIRPADSSSNKFDNCFIALDRVDNCRQGAQNKFDQLSIAYIADSDPQDRWAIAPCGPTKGKVAILSDEDRRARKGFVPNLQIGSCLQAEIDNVNGLAAGLAQCLCERRRKLRVDQKGQSLFRRDNGMVRLPGGKGQNRIDVGVFKIRIILKDRLAGLAGRQ